MKTLLPSAQEPFDLADNSAVNPTNVIRVYVYYPLYPTRTRSNLEGYFKHIGQADLCLLLWKQGLNVAVMSGKDI